jgi:hypothetical protein
VPERVSPPLAGLAYLVGRATGQSLTSGNRIEPLIDGEQAYPAMLAAIESARHSVALASYIFDSQGIGAQFVDALRRAHARANCSHGKRWMNTACGNLRNGYSSNPQAQLPEPLLLLCPKDPPHE